MTPDIDDDLKRAVLGMSVAPALRRWFGAEWYRRGDPRTVAGMTLHDLQNFARAHGIPDAVLAEGRWGGDDLFVIAPDGDRWRVGFAERGDVRLIGTAATKEDARDLVVRELFDLYETASNPSYWKDGVAAGTPMAAERGGTP